MKLVVNKPQEGSEYSSVSKRLDDAEDQRLDDGKLQIIMATSSVGKGLNSIFKLSSNRTMLYNAASILGLPLHRLSNKPAILIGFRYLLQRPFGSPNPCSSDLESCMNPVHGTVFYKN